MFGGFLAFSLGFYHRGNFGDLCWGFNVASGLLLEHFLQLSWGFGYFPASDRYVKATTIVTSTLKPPSRPKSPFLNGALIGMPG